MPGRLKLAYFSPLNPVQSGISDYSEELLPALARYADLDLYLDNYTPSNREIAARFNIYPTSKFARQSGRYDNYLFHMGNSAAHAYIYKTLLNTQGKGILVLHDFVLHHFMIGQYLNHGQAAEYIRQMGRFYGSEGETIAREVIKGKFAESLFKYPFNEAAIEAAQAVLVHSRFAQSGRYRPHGGAAAAPGRQRDRPRPVRTAPGRIYPGISRPSQPLQTAR